MEIVNNMGRKKKTPYNICKAIIDTFEKLKFIKNKSKGIRIIDNRRRKLIIHIIRDKI